MKYRPSMVNCSASGKLSRAILLMSLFSASGYCRSDVSGGYFLRSPNQLALLTVTKTGHTLRGFIQSVTRNVNIADGFSVAQLRFAADISGSSFTTHSELMDQIFGGSIGNCSGSFGSGGLRLDIPLSSGQTSILHLVRSTAEAWNRAVSKFEAVCRRDALSQRWRVDLRSHVLDLKRQSDGAQSDFGRLAQEKANEAATLPKLEANMRRAEERVHAANRSRDAAKERADRAAEVAKEAQQEEVQGSTFNRGFLALTLNDSDPGQGVVVSGVLGGGPGEAAGVRIGDVIVRVASEAVGDQTDLAFAMLKCAPGSPVELEFVRAGERKTASLTPSAPPPMNSIERSRRTASLQLAQAQQENRLAQAENVVAASVNGRVAAQSGLDEINRQIQATQTGIQNATSVQNWAAGEGSILAAGRAYISKLEKGSLWVGVALAAGTITRRPFSGSSVLSSYQAGQGLSVVPMGSEWCLVELQSRVLGWTKRANINVKKG